RLGRPAVRRPAAGQAGAWPRSKVADGRRKVADGKQDGPPEGGPWCHSVQDASIRDLTPGLHVRAGRVLAVAVQLDFGSPLAVVAAVLGAGRDRALATRVGTLLLGR